MATTIEKEMLMSEIAEGIAIENYPHFLDEWSPIHTIISFENMTPIIKMLNEKGITNEMLVWNEGEKTLSIYPNDWSEGNYIELATWAIDDNDNPYPLSDDNVNVNLVFQGDLMDVLCIGTENQIMVVEQPTKAAIQVIANVITMIAEKDYKGVIDYLKSEGNDKYR